MKLLVSAYACEPNKGSEPGVGWNWVQALLRRGYDLHVITRSNNREAIEAAMAGNRLPVKFVYYDLPARALGWKHRSGGIYLYYLLWQWGAYRLARKLHAVERFDRVHHVTFASYRQPSFMGGLGIPFIFGPVGGGESMPSSFRRGLPFSRRIEEASRNLGNALIAWDPLVRRTFAQAQVVACTTSETAARIPRRFQSKCLVQPAIGINPGEIAAAIPAPPEAPQFLFVGRLLYWKGLHLLLRAMAIVHRSVPNARLKIIGSGEDGAWLRTVEKEAGVAALVEWVPAKPQSEIWREYRESLAFAFPSLHDSGGMVVLEALAAGLPVICLNLGGPGAMMNSSCGIVVDSGAGDEATVIEELASAMVRVAIDPEMRARLSNAAIAHAWEMTWDAAAEAIYSRVAGQDAALAAELSERGIH
jgi:glycosyltransferase involved in cell wall biosynthesis